MRLMPGAFHRVGDLPGAKSRIVAAVSGVTLREFRAGCRNMNRLTVSGSPQLAWLMVSSRAPLWLRPRGSIAVRGNAAATH